MRRVLTGYDQLFGPWMMNILGSRWIPGRGSTIGLWEDDKGPIAACLYEASNGASVLLHIATDGSKRWMNREFLWFCHFYPFEQLRVQKIVCPVESTNIECIKFIEHLGYSLEATLKDCAPGGDLLLYTMRKEQCRWLTLREHHGKTQSTCAA